MPKGIHPNILFHFTKKEALYNILSHNFKISYARELIIGPNHRRQLGVPMVSFCDLKLSELSKFIQDDYGKYAIGLKKEWAYRNNVCPVMYMSRAATMTDKLIEGIDGIFNQMKKIDNIQDFEEANNYYQNVLNMYRYIKNYDGELYRHDHSPNLNYRFADDREWRYVPDFFTEGIWPLVPITLIDTSEKKTELNRQASHLTLSFEPDDIQYLIVTNDSEINDLITHLEEVKGRFDLQTRLRLTSRILTIDQIQNDI